MMCVQNSLIKELDEIIKDVQSTSNQFRGQICHAKCQVTKLVRMQIQRFKDRKDPLHSGSNQTLMNSYEINQADASTDPLIDDNLLNHHINYLNDYDTKNDTIDTDDHLAGTKSYTKNLEGFSELKHLRKDPETIHTLNPEDQVVTENVQRPQYFEGLRRFPQFSKTTKKIISALVIGFLVWISLVFGALLGASMCTNGYCFLSSSRRPTIF